MLHDVIRSARSLQQKAVERLMARRAIDEMKMTLHKKKERLTEKPLVIYAAGARGREMLGLLTGWGIWPVAFCDTDSKKHGQDFMGVPIRPVESVIEQYGIGGFRIIVATKVYFKEIEYKLVSIGIPASDILSSEIKQYLETGEIVKPLDYSTPQIAKLKKHLFDLLQLIHNICEENGIKYYLYGGTLLGAVRHKGFIPWDDDMDILMFRKDHERFHEICRRTICEPYVFVDREDKSQFTIRHKIIIKDSAVKYLGAPLHEHINVGVSIDIFPLDNVSSKDGIRTSIQEHVFMAAYKAYQVQSGRNLYENWGIRLAALALSRLPKSILLKLMLAATTRYNKVEDTEYVYYFCPAYGYRKNRTFRRDYFSARILLEFEGSKFWAPVGYKQILREMYGEDYMTPPPPEIRFSSHNPVELCFGVLEDSHYV